MKSAAYLDFVSFFFQLLNFFFVDLILHSGQYIIQFSSNEEEYFSP